MIIYSKFFRSNLIFTKNVFNICTCILTRHLTDLGSWRRDAPFLSEVEVEREKESIENNSMFLNVFSRKISIINNCNDRSLRTIDDPPILRLKFIISSLLFLFHASVVSFATSYHMLIIITSLIF